LTHNLKTQFCNTGIYVKQNFQAFRFSRSCSWGFSSSGLWHCVTRQAIPNVSRPLQWLETSVTQKKRVTWTKTSYDDHSGGTTPSMGCLQYYSPCVFCIFKIKASAEV